MPVASLSSAHLPNFPDPSIFPEVRTTSIYTLHSTTTMTCSVVVCSYILPVCVYLLCEAREASASLLYGLDSSQTQPGQCIHILGCPRPGAARCTVEHPRRACSATYSMDTIGDSMLLPASYRSTNKLPHCYLGFIEFEPSASSEAQLFASSTRIRGPDSVIYCCILRTSALLTSWFSFRLSKQRHWLAAGVVVRPTHVLARAFSPVKT